MPFKGEPGNECGSQARQASTSSSSSSWNSIGGENGEVNEDACGSKRGNIQWAADGTCRQLYTQGPCNVGEWIVPDRGKGQRKGRGWKMGKCECRPGFTPNRDEKTNITTCLPPVVSIAKFLNSKSYQFSNSPTSNVANTTQQSRFKPSTTYKYKNHRESISTERSTEILTKNTVSPDGEGEALNHRHTDRKIPEDLLSQPPKTKKEFKDKRQKSADDQPPTEGGKTPSYEEKLESTTNPIPSDQSEIKDILVNEREEEKARALKEDLNEPEKESPLSTPIPVIDLETLFDELSSSSIELK